MAAAAKPMPIPGNPHLATLTYSARGQQAQLMAVPYAERLQPAGATFADALTKAMQASSKAAQGGPDFTTHAVVQGRSGAFGIVPVMGVSPDSSFPTNAALQPTADLRFDKLVVTRENPALKALVDGTFYADLTSSKTAIPTSVFSMAG